MRGWGVFALAICLMPAVTGAQDTLQYDGTFDGADRLSAAGATVSAIHVYELNGSLADALGGPALVSAGGTLNGTGYSFDANQGLSLSGSSIDRNDYSIELIFRLGELGGYRKIIDFKDLAELSGLYNFSNRVNFRLRLSGPNNAFSPGSIVHLLVTRERSSNQFSAYVNGTLHFSLTDSDRDAVFDAENDVIHFFTDDLASGQSEASAGTVDRIRIFDGPLSSTEAFDLWRDTGATEQQTVGLLRNDPASFDGYTLFGTLTTGPMHLIDNQGRLINEWTSAFPTGNAIYLMPDGDLLRASRFEPTPQPRFNAGGRGGRIERFDWDGNIVWDFIYATADYRHHHDMALLPNGNLLLIAWELKTREEAIQAGRDPALLPDDEMWPEKIVEIEPDGATGGNVVWEWHIWDHLIQDVDPGKDNFGVVADHPELVDVNFVNGRSGSAEWLHANAIDYNPERDEIVLCIPFLEEFWVIDHSTTNAEAAGHTGGNRGRGGDLLYRWGNPQAYRRGTDADRVLWFQHDSEWIDAGAPGGGNILVFNNGRGRPDGLFTSIEEIVPPTDANGDYVIAAGQAYGPAAPVWSYTAEAPTDVYAAFLSSAQRLPNGNTLIANGPAGVFFEVQPDGTEVWRYVNPVSVGGPIPQGTPATNRTFRAERYAPDYPGLVGQDVTPGDPLELFTRPLPAPDGSAGTTPLTVSRLEPSSNDLNVKWDTTSCPSSGYQLLHGELADVATYTLNGAECSIGTVGSYDWLGVPASSLYFLVVGVDDIGVYESSWGTDSAGVERGGDAASGQCAATNKVSSGSCP